MHTALLAALAGSRGTSRDLAGRLIASFVDHRWYILLVLLYAAATVLVGETAGASQRVSVSLYNTVLFENSVWFFVLFLLIGRPLYVLARHRPQRPTRFIIADWRANYLRLDRLLVAAPVVLVTPTLMSSYTSLKLLIPVLHPYSWDAAFAEWDRLLHFGTDPWRLLQPVLGYPFVTMAVNVIYNLWMLIIFVVIFWQAFTLADPQRRMQFFVAFALCWSLLGSAMATWLSSAGPCYFPNVTGQEGAFVPLMDYLRAADERYPIWALDTQEMLWANYEAGGLTLGSGISAMPSMHVSMALLCAFAGWRSGRVLRVLLAAFVVLIVVGSVHLAWHYAIDAYVALAATWLIWWASGCFLRSSAARFGQPAGASRVLSSTARAAWRP